MAMMMENFRPKKSREGFSFLLHKEGDTVAKTVIHEADLISSFFRKRNVYVKKIEMEQKYTYAAQHLKGLFVIVIG